VDRVARGENKKNKTEKNENTVKRQEKNKRNKEGLTLCHTWEIPGHNRKREANNRTEHGRKWAALQEEVEGT
jgi:hypothetical protein